MYGVDDTSHRAVFEEQAGVLIGPTYTCTCRNNANARDNTTVYCLRFQIGFIKLGDHFWGGVNVPPAKGLSSPWLGFGVVTFLARERGMTSTEGT